MARHYEGRRPRALRCETLEERRMLAVITVDTVADVFDTGDGRTSLREAIFVANTVPGADEIVFAGSDFSSGATISLQQGELRVADPLTITGPLHTTLTIDGRNESRIINFEGGGLLTLTRLTLNRGRVTVDNPPEFPEASISTLGSGGALRAAVGNVALNDVTVLNSSVTGVNAHGGGVFVKGSRFEMSLTVTNSRFAGNRAEGPGGEGGSLAVWGFAEVTNTQISESWASRGGGIASTHWVNLTASTLDNNTAFDDELSAGGGLYSTGYAAIVNCTISGNAAEATGTNARAHGAGIFTNEARIEYSTVAANTASSMGPASEALGGGVFGIGNVSLLSTIVAGNSSAIDADLHLTIPSSIYASLIGDGRGSLQAEAPLGAPNDSRSLIGGTKQGLIDPLLKPLADNGGRTQTHALAFGSPAVGSGDSFLNGGPPAYDQRGIGFPRIAGARIDMGAVESDIRSWIVDTVVDEEDGNLAVGDLSLREALWQALFSPGEDLIEFSSTFYSSQRKTISLTLGPLTAGLGIDIRGPGANLLTIDASGNDPTPLIDDGQGSSVLVVVPVGGSEVVLSGVTLTGGDSSGVGGFASAGITTLTNVTIVDNYGEGQAGGLSGEVLTIRASRIDGNRVSGGAGSAAGGVNAKSLTLQRSIIANNKYVGTQTGLGGISVTQDALITDSEIVGNESLRGVGAMVKGATGHLEVVNSLVRGNRGTEGGIWIDSPFTIRGSSVVDNVASERGGGLYLRSAGEITNSTISGNSAGVAGGGIQILSASPVAIRHSTISNNFASNGGGIAGTTVDLDHSIVAGNSSDFGVSDPPIVRFASYSLIGNGVNSGLTEAPVGSPDANGNLVGGSVYGVIDARLGPLADNGGATLPGGGKLLTHRPLVGSPAINAGDATLEAGVGNAPAFDERGAPFSRVVGARIDIGAVESIGAPIVVDTLVDESDGDYRSGDLSLREAIELANAQPGADEIVFAPALFANGPGTILLTRGELVSFGDIAVHGPGAAILTLDAGGNDPTPGINDRQGTRVFNVLGVGADQQATISGLAMTGGDIFDSGGAVYSEQALTLADVRIFNNAAADRGGGVYSSSLVHITNSTIEGNHVGVVQGLSGGGGVAGRNVVLENAVVRDNVSASRGGGIYALQGLTASNSVFYGNTARNGGGGAWVSGGVELTGVLIKKNRTEGSAQVAHGGGLYLANSVSATISNSTLVENFAGVQGGAIATGSNQQPITLLHTTVSGNGARFGGGIHGGVVTVRHSAVVENRIVGAGGDFVGGGGISARSVTLEHSIVAQNSEPQFPASDVVGLSSARWSLIGDGRGAGLAETPLGIPDANGNLIGGPAYGVIDPKLSPLADNGGPTLPGGAKLLTHAPLPGSPVVDAGDPALVPGTGGVPEFDQRGAPFSRVVGARIDIGAVESIGAPIVVDTLVDESDGDYRSGDLSLREAIELANAQPGAETIVFDPALFASGPGTILLTRGELAISDSLNLVGPGLALLTIDASGNDPTPDEDKGDGSRHFLIDDGSGTHQVVQVGSLTLQGGDVFGDGGAILTREELILDRVHIVGNSATQPRVGSLVNDGSGGAVASFRSLLLRDSIVSGNRGGFGGGVYVNGTALIERSEISHNASFGDFGSGGGILGRGSHVITISQSSLHSNSAKSGSGGLRSEGGTVTIVSTVVAENFGGTVGGGVGVRGGRLNLVASTIARNSAGHGGGGIWLSDGFAHELRDSTISGNSANRSGGGLYLERVNQLTAARLTITDNRADADGAQPLGAGGGIFGLMQGMSVSHTVVAGNSIGAGTTSSDVAGSSGQGSLGNVFRNSLIGDGANSTLSEAPLGLPDANGNLVGGPVHGVIDPKLSPLADNGGPTLPGGAKLLTHAPLPGSPVIDAGDPAFLPGTGGVPEFDQRGAPYSRLTGSRVDIGAVESQTAGGALSGDFDLDGVVNGNDFLAWQRGLGRVGVVTIRHGDATADGDVDASDLEVWKARAAEAASGPLSAIGQSGAAEAVAATSAMDAVFAAGDFSRLFAAGPSAQVRGKWRPMRRGM